MPDTPRRVVLAGASGLIGAALAQSLREDGVQVTRLVRRPAVAADEVSWLTSSELLDPEVLRGADAVVGLNGATIGRFPWTARYRSTLLWSRLTPTRTLADAVAALGDDAPHFVSASAVGWYPSLPGRRQAEGAERGHAFISDLVAAWEQAASRAGDRVALLRTAPVVHRAGVLRPLITLTKAGLSGPIGSGTQVWPWISLPDEVRAIRHVIENRITGPVNLTGPTRAVANDLGFALAVALNRPFVLRAPEFALRAVLGRHATEAILTSDLDIVPAVLQRTGFTFQHSTVEDAVRAALAD